MGLVQHNFKACPTHVPPHVPPWEKACPDVPPMSRSMSRLNAMKTMT